MNKSRALKSTSNVQNIIKLEVSEIILFLKTRRRLAKISQEFLAELIEVNVNTIKYIEQGRRFPSLPMLIRILIALDCKIKIEKN
jgi:transcriptional regulator with XRE-family HTH domain